MKFLVAIIVISMTVVVHGYAGCAKETGADVVLVNRTRHGDFNFEDVTLKQFFFCMYKKMGICEDSGKILPNAILKLADDSNREPVTKAVEACKGMSAEKSEDLPWYFAKCYSKEFPEDIYVLE